MCVIVCVCGAAALFYVKRFHPIFLERGQRISAYMSKLNAHDESLHAYTKTFNQQGGSQKHTCFRVSTSYIVGSVLAEGMDYQQYLENRATLANRLAVRSTRFTIPKMTHHIWLTDPQRPREVSEEDIRTTLKTLQMLPASDGWRHILWVNKEGLIPKTLDALQQAGPIEVRTVSKKHLVNFSIFKKSYEKSFGFNFAMASDIVRIAVLEAYGGVYLDFDFEVLKSLDEQVNTYSFFAFENSMIGAHKHHPILQNALKMQNRNLLASAPYYVRHPCSFRDLTKVATGPLLLYAAFVQSENISGYKDIYFHRWMIEPLANMVRYDTRLGKHNVSGSWHKTGDQLLFDSCSRCVRIEDAI